MNPTVIKALLFRFKFISPGLILDLNYSDLRGGQMTRSGYSGAARTTHVLLVLQPRTFSTKLPACAEICFASFPQTTKNLNKSRGERVIHHNLRPAETLVNIGGLSGGCRNMQSALQTGEKRFL